LNVLPEEAKERGDLLREAQQSLLRSPAIIFSRYPCIYVRDGDGNNEGLPPTSNSIYQHIARTNCQTMVWKRCLQVMQQLPSPSGNGWEMTQESGLKPVLMTQEVAPDGLVELTVCTCKKSVCKSSLQWPCTEACGCMGDDCCQNPHNQQIDDEDSSDDEA